MAKAPSIETLVRMEMEGKASQVSVPVRGYLIHETGNIIWAGDNGETRDGFITVRDRDGIPVVEPRESSLEKFAARIREGAAGILVLLNGPAAKLLELVLGVDFGKARAVVSAATARDDADKVLRLVLVLGKGRLLQVAEAIEKAKADGTITLAEASEINRIARGRT